jgi:hypothetical protein
MPLRIIRHRVNALSDLRALPAGHGAEIDLRTQGRNIILNHEPYEPGESFEAFCQVWAADRNRGTLIVNPKEDGVESATLAILASRGIDDFFFLDLTIPTTVRLAVKEKMAKIAIRVSEYEPLEGALTFAGLCEWVWLDSFTGVAPSEELARELTKKFRVCLVSPELQKYPPDLIPNFRHLLPHLTAVCTKHPERWTTLARS